MNRAIAAYRTAATTVAPPAAVTLLFDEVLNAIALAAGHLKRKEFEEAHARVMRATGILRGLRQNIDTDYAEAMGNQLVLMYTRNIFALNSAIGKPDAIDRFATLAEGILELRNAWAEMTSLTPRCQVSLLSEIRREEMLQNMSVS